MKKKNTTSTTDNSQDSNTLLGLSADSNTEHILGEGEPIVNVNIDLSGVEAKLAKIAETQDKIYETQDKIYELLKKDDTNVALKAMLWTTLTLHFKAIQKMPNIFKRNLTNSKSVLDDMIQ